MHGEYVLRVPGTSIVIDGASENSPFELPRCCASYANHSEQPNARLELWPVLRPAPCEARQHMVLVASEPIAAGGEIRIDYDHGSKSRSHGTKAFKAKGASSTYWGGAQQGQPGESLAWRQAHCHPPPPAAEGERLVNGLARHEKDNRDTDPATVVQRYLDDLILEVQEAERFEDDKPKGNTLKLT